MKEILDFMLELSKHNYKPWFDEHKTEYKAIRSQFEAFAVEFLHGIEEFEPLTKRDVLKKNFLENAIADLKKTYEFTELLNKCYDYAYEEDK